MGDQAPPLEGETACICGALEGAHQVGGECPETGCTYFVAEEFGEDPTRPDVVVEYDDGVDPLGGVIS